MQQQREEILDQSENALLLLPQDFLRCVTAAIIYFAISIAAVSKYSDGASKAAGVFGFAATIVFAIDFYITFNDLVTFLKQGSSDSPEGRKTEGGWNSCFSTDSLFWGF
uniref:CKLF like MARVEL transmembrane domain containing 3 n=1 Tax=Zosterops lateralis melanops TaxID=1220523 RepID=A0A8D2PHB9_ZOSLA